MTVDRLLRGCHPAVSFSYFALVIACAMFFMHPLCLALSLLGAGCCAAQLVGGRGLRQRIVWLLPMALLAALVNPAFVHQGATILTYFPSGNPLTLESILYGCASGVLLAAVVLWFVCVTDVITSDKVVYLFGRIIPALSLLLSMTLRFVPQFTRRLRTVAQAQRRLGRDTGRGSVRRRLREAMRVFSIVVTWSLESGLIAADSMRGRGYGLPGRTAFALYRLNHDGDGVFGTCIFEGLQIIVRCVGESVGHRSESNLASITRLTCCRHGTKGSSMESHLCSYDMITVWAIFFNAIFTGHFDHCLVSRY